MAFVENEFFLLALTLAVFFAAKWVQQRTGQLLLNPILVTIAVMIVFLKSLGITYETYSVAGKYIEFWLKPAIVALGVPLYLQLKAIRKQWLPILLSQLAGCVVGIVSVVLTAKVLGASREVMISLAPKSVTTPIAMEIAQTVGGIPSLAAAVVVCTGLMGAVLGFQILKLCRVKSPIAQGLAIGTASHALGTSAAAAESAMIGAYSSLGLTLNGILTAIFTPTLLQLMGIIH